VSFDFRDIRGPEVSKQENYSRLCSRIVMQLFPDARPVDGSGGDEGVDTYIGTFNGLCRVFEHKYFLDRVKAVQRRQVERSLHQVSTHHRVTEWTLMVPTDFNPSEIRWFQSLRQAYPDTALDWWGRTKLDQLLGEHPHIAKEFTAVPTVVTLIFKHGLNVGSSAAEFDFAIKTQLGLGIGFRPGADILDAIAADIRNRSRLSVVVWGPGPAGSDLYEKRCTIRAKLRELGHSADFSEEVWNPERLRRSGLNIKVAEFIQAKSYDYIICLMTSPGSIGEVHDFANHPQLASKMMICVDVTHKTGYSALGALRIFEGHNGRLDWFTAPIDLTECHLASRVLEQVDRVAEAKQYLMTNAWGSS
jgi:hypothetical protein